MSRKLAELMRDPERMETFAEMLRSGANISTIEAKLSIPSGTVTRWLNRGKVQKAGVYREFYNYFRSTVADAKHFAEMKMLERSPERWLDRSTSAKVIESNEELSLAQQSSSSLLQVGAEKAIQALLILKQQGVSVDQLLEKGSITVNDAIGLPTPTKKDISND